MGLGGVIPYVLSLGAKLLPSVHESSQQASSSSSPLVQQHQIETEMEKIMELRERINATLSAADQREIKDNSVKLWLKELKRLVYNAEDVLDEYQFEILRAQVEASDDFMPKSHERKLIHVPDNMLEQIQQIESKFVEIEKDRIALQLLEEDGPRYSNSDQQIAPTSHCVLESDIIGREKEKKELINLLFSKCPDGKIISVVAIVGTGGIGKTTLAQLVYNDQRIRQNFDKFVWVCVSEDFNVQKLTREVVESITGKPYGLANLSALQENICKEIRRERVFLVLDDVWNEKRSHWELFQAPFMVASLVKILVTTRNKPVAQIMQTMPTFNLGYMSKEQSWKLFQHYAFGEVNQNRGSNLVGIGNKIMKKCGMLQSWKLFQHYAFGEVNQNRGSNLVGIGKKIMKKCGMLPLAVKSIGSLLRHEIDKESWKQILESQLWESDAGSEIFSSLQISYARLPSYLKPCFLYCSMFPRNYRCSVEKLVQLWIYQGYVQTNKLKNVEKIGREYAKQLWQRSFFEGEYGEKEFQFTLHDMIHDLARYNSGHGCYSIEGDVVPNFPEELYHLYVDSRVKLIKAPSSTKFTTLRTLIVEDHCNEVSLGNLDFSKASKLRALQFGSRKCDLEACFSFVDLKHLWYLSISWGCFKRLPENICSLYNLQNLTLYYCYHLIDLPKSIGNLISLEELRIFGSANLRMLPVSICQLKVLRKLDLCGCTNLSSFHLTWETLRILNF
ncbi:Disease resistance protein (CC-NBS-LRR class) family [Rhynchospora pubera]|uniref:Disease resistance protein (CC-NBS-LRR class) family n=1 Tax=Rhynchospora pubera TaxID=906938 RepID=A0AAV8GRW5_9POAL|nr:Disease resistance protein (CC-NBS-LRR class) family [Rhynchospora pubera]